MTLKEALESGKRFKRKPDSIYINPMFNPTFSVSAVVAEDWEIEEFKKSFTENELSTRLYLSPTFNRTKVEADTIAEEIFKRKPND